MSSRDSHAKKYGIRECVIEDNDTKIPLYFFETRPKLDFAGQDLKTLKYLPMMKLELATPRL